MALLTKTGSFATGTGTTSIVITGLGFVPKFIFFWDSRQTSATDAVTSLSNERSMGFATGTADRRAVGQRGSSLIQKMITRDDACIATAVTAGTVDGLLDIASIDADGFTIAVDDNFGASHIIGYWAVGGDDITATSIGTFTEPASTGDQDITTPAFQPDAVFLLASSLGTPPTTGANCTPMFGVAVATASTPDNAVWAGFGKDGVATTVLKSYCRTGECVAMWSSAGAIDGEASCTSMLSNGFRLNWTARATTTRNLFYLAVKGGSYKVNSITTLTNTTGDISSGSLGFAPKGGLVVSAQQTAASTAGTAQADDRWSFGGFSANASIDQRVLATSDEDNVGTGVISNGVHYADVYLNINRATAGTLDGSMTVRAINPNSFDFRMTDADPSGVFAWFVAIGRVEASTFQAPQYPGLRGIGPPTEWARHGAPFLPPATVAAASGAVTVASTGNAATGSPGTVTVSTDLPVTGNQATGSPGDVAPATSVAAAGIGATGAAGTVDFTKSGSVAASGVQATGSAGTAGAATDAPVTGAGATGGAGDVSPSTAVAVTGAVGTGTPGTVAPSTTVGVVGNAAAGQVGTVGTANDGSVAVTGVQATGQAGTVTGSQAGQTSASGNAGTGDAGTVSPSTSVATTGVVGAGQAGTVTVSVAVDATGAGAAGSAGDVAVSGAGTASVTGVQTTGGAGDVSPSVVVAASGVGAAGAAGTVTTSGGTPAVVPVYLLTGRARPNVAELFPSATSTDLAESRAVVTFELAQG